MLEKARIRYAFLGAPSSASASTRRTARAFCNKSPDEEGVEPARRSVDVARALGARGHVTLAVIVSAEGHGLAVIADEEGEGGGTSHRIA